MIRLTYSLRGAARLLGIDRGRTLHDLIRTGAIHVIPWGRRWRISADELRRVAREGIPDLTQRPGHVRRRRQPVDAGTVGDAIRAIGAP